MTYGVATTPEYYREAQAVGNITEHSSPRYLAYALSLCYIGVAGFYGAEALRSYSGLDFRSSVKVWAELRDAIGLAIADSELDLADPQINPAQIPEAI